MTLPKRFSIWLPILLIAGAAIFLRVYQIDRLPPGLFGDEAVEGLDALDVLAGNLGIWFHAHLGREPIYVYLVALAYQFFGVTPLATRLPAIIAGLLTIPATFLFAREWAAQLFSPARAKRIAMLATALVAISFWHIQMTRDAHRDTLLPLVQAIGYWLLWRARRTRDWKMYAGAGAVLGLAIYTYSPGRFVGVFVAVFFAVEWVVHRAIEIAATKAPSRPASAGVLASVLSGATDFVAESKDREAIPKPGIGDGSGANAVPRNSTVSGLILAALCALVIMLPLGIYFAQNPAQFSRRFASVSIFDFPSPSDAFVSSVAGNLAQFVVPGVGYQSKHYNLPGKPVFDLLIAPWFLIGLVIALTRWRQPQYRFLLLWFVVMLTPAFLTADMIPKGVRVLGVVPGVFVFPALAMEWLWDFGFRISDFRFFNRQFVIRNSQFLVRGLVVICIVGSAAWTGYDYFVAWASAPDLPLAFDADLVEVSDFINQQPADQQFYISEEVYRPPTLMLLGERVPTSHYVDPATRFKEADARTTLIFGAHQSNAVYIFIRDYAPPAQWLARVAPPVAQIGAGNYFEADRLAPLAPPQRSVDVSFNPFLKLIGVSRFADDPTGVVLYWQVAQLPPDRTDIQATVSLADASGAAVAQGKHPFGAPPLEWALGDTMVEWYALDAPASATQFSIELARGESKWVSPLLPLE